MSEIEFHFPNKNGTRANRPNKDFKRAYMACIQCRRTKAKCELSDDSVSCVKCRRERRDCVFSAERSTKKRRKMGESEAEKSRRGNTVDAQPKSRGLRQGNEQNVRQDGSGTHSSERAFVADYSLETPIPLQGSSSTVDVRESQNSISDHQDETLINANEPTPHRPSSSTLDADVMRTVVSSSRDALGLLFKAAEQQDSDESEEQNHATANVFDSPGSALTSGAAPASLPPSALSNPSANILELWGHSRFVRQGWFSAREAVTYMDLFFHNLSSLSPISTSFYSNHENHRKLILQEPLLCCTLLMISSRYHVLPGPGGASRALFIHARLWKHCEHLIQRITFGQEKYSIAKTRTLGSISALLLITEWHPRALHFPPDTDGWDSSLAPSIDDTYGRANRNEDANMIRWREEVFEPAKRSDRMSWMLLGLATTLAHELGVFDGTDGEDDQIQTGMSKWHMGRLLFLNVNQLALRVGCTSLLPQNTIQSISYPSVHAGLSDDANRERDALITLWIDVTKLLKTAREMFFANKTSTRQILKSGRYIDLLEHFQPLLAQWQTAFSNLQSTTLSEASLQMLSIDYNYVRMYLNSLAIQAIVERTTSRGTTDMSLDYDIMRVENGQDYRFIQEVIEGSREILSKAVTLAENGVLRYSPVRIFLRITSASIFLLKAISLGVRNSELQKSLDTLDRCIQALRYSTLDDVHLSSRYGVLIERHVRRFRRNFRVQSGLSNITVPPSPRQSTVPQPTGISGDMLPNIVPSYTGGNAESLETLYGQFDVNLPLDDWLVQPFDPSIGFGLNQSASGLELDSLDFLWNLAS